jgi:DeoR/GlpR family transcriptional regulator of sugar metabolism
MTPFARVEQISHLITDDGLSAEWVEKLQQAQIKFTLCKE